MCFNFSSTLNNDQTYNNFYEMFSFLIVVVNRNREEGVQSKEDVIKTKGKAM